jgi:hypothetical protein
MLADGAFFSSFTFLCHKLQHFFRKCESNAGRVKSAVRSHNQLVTKHLSVAHAQSFTAAISVTEIKYDVGKMEAAIWPQVII